MVSPPPVQSFGASSQWQTHQHSPTLFCFCDCRNKKNNDKSKMSHLPFPALISLHYNGTLAWVILRYFTKTSLSRPLQRVSASFIAQWSVCFWRATSAFAMTSTDLFFGNKLVHVFQCSSALCLAGSRLCWPASAKRTPTSPCWSCPRSDGRESRRRWWAWRGTMTDSCINSNSWYPEASSEVHVNDKALKLLVPDWDCHWSSWFQTGTVTGAPVPRLGLWLELLVPDWLSLELLVPDTDCHWSSWSQTDSHRTS